MSFDILGRAAAPWDINRIDWVPTPNLGHKKSNTHSETLKSAERAGRALKRRQKKAKVSSVVCTLHYCICKPLFYRVIFQVS